MDAKTNEPILAPKSLIDIIQVSTDTIEPFPGIHGVGTSGGPVVAVFVASTAALASGKGISMARSAVGTYTFTFSGGAFVNIPFLTVTIISSAANAAWAAPDIFSLTPTGFSMEQFDRTGTKGDPSFFHVFAQEIS